ncbi:MAG: hypothetical protein C4308_03415 [Chitinophagaceae bacterium]
MFEKKHQSLASRKTYYKRIAKHTYQVFVILFLMLGIGTVGYHYSTLPTTEWLDAFHNASMILSGMGPVITEHFTDGGKIFSSFYALFSGIIFITSISYILAPGVHRIFHRLHLEEGK